MKINKNILFLVIILATLAIATFLAYRYFYLKVEKMPPASPPTANATSSTPVATGLKTYRNEEWGFEFQYPEDWVLRENASGYSPLSKFDLVGAPAEKEYLIYRPSVPFLINIATSDFADRAVISLKNLNANISTVLIAGVKGTKYEYKFENTLQIGIDLPFGGYRLLLGANKQYEDIFNQILASFKFLK